jgi:hypothetical protein
MTDVIANRHFDTDPSREDEVLGAPEELLLTATARDPHFRHLLNAKALNDHSVPMEGATVSHTTTGQRYG